MKRRLIFQFLFWNIIVLYIVQFLFFGVNLLSVHKGFSFSNNFYNFSFDPHKFTEEYKEKFENNSNGFNLIDEDIKVLVDNNIWIQILDKSNKEIYSVNKPEEIPKEYLAADLIKYSNNGWKIPKPSTIYSETFNRDGERYSLILGFSINDVVKHSFLFTNESIKFYISLIVLTYILTIIAGYLFSRRLASPMVDIIEDIKSLSQGDYSIKSRKKPGIYKEVNENIEVLANILKENNEERKNIEKIKEEWIANIAHDLKTPLSSVKGYAQLISSEDYKLDEQDIKEYGNIIVSKTDYIEELISDLSLIYKFKNRVVPLKIERENIVDIIRETVIDILNSPEYEDRDININYDSEEIYLNCDKRYIKRALNNFIFNGLIHNPKDTKMNINIEEKSNIIIEIEDNGNGINKEELKSLFHRYYRATNTGESHKGSGLGMAISKEIIELHNGEIEVLSEISKGTKIVIKISHGKD